MNEAGLIRAVHHRGRVDCAALAIDAALVGEDVALERAVALWGPGTTVTRLAERWILLRFSPARSVRAEQEPGLVLTLRGGALVGLPLEDEIWESLAAPPGSTVMLVGGALQIWGPADESAIDPELLVDTHGFALAAVEPLGLPPAPPVVAPPPPSDLRQMLEARGVHLEAPPPEQAEVERQLAKLAAGAEGRSAPPLEAGRRPGLLRSAWQMLKRALSEALASRAGRSPSPAPAGGQARGAKAKAEASAGLIAPPAPEQRPSRLAWLGEALRKLQLRVLWYTRLGRLVGERHARYLDQMLEKFAKGDLNEALRWAIPLSKGGPGDDRTPQVPFSAPRPRDALRIATGGGGPQSTLFASSDLFEQLRQVYRRAFTQLDNEGQFERAAFVLAELLQQTEEAVAYLERRKLYRLAAELAEARKLPAAIVVRQWMIAGDLERALKIARAQGLTAQVIAQLEQRDPENGKKLRLYWAAVRAEAGSYAEAVRIVWPVPEGRALAGRWIDLALEVGGQAAAQMLALRLIGFPDRATDSLAQIERLLSDRSRAFAPDRLTFGLELVERGASEEGSGPRVSRAAKLAFRSLLADRGEFLNRQGLELFTRLATLSGDGVLRADLPALEARAPEAETDFLLMEVPEGDRGMTPLFDAALLPSGKLLVAQDEAGVVLLSRAGRPLQRYPVPAQELVVSEHGDRALAIGLRSDHVVVSKIDLVAGRAQLWLEAELDAWASDFDGETWYAAKGSTLFAVDALKPKLHSEWKVDAGARIEQVAASTSSFLMVSVSEDDRAELWQYEAAGRTLRTRGALAAESVLAIDAVTALLYKAGRLTVHAGRDHKVAARSRTFDPRARFFYRGPAYGAVTHVNPRSVEIDAAKDLDDVGVMLIVPADAGEVSMRFCYGHAVIADRAGRLFVCDLATHSLVRSLRI